MSRWLALALLLVVSLISDTGCSWSPAPPGADLNGDGAYGFSDLQMGYQPSAEPTFEQRFEEHMERQEADCKE